MFRVFILFLLFITSLFGSRVDSFRWPDGISYLMFLEQHKLPVEELYYELDKDDQKLLEEVRAGTNCQNLVSQEGEVLQTLIPMNDELQIHLYKHKGKYHFEIIPIISETRREAFVLKITHSPYLDIIRETGSKKLAQIFVANYRYSLNFKRDLRKGDTLIMMYDQKYRLGNPFSMPILKAAMIEMRGKKHYIYHNSKDDRYYNKEGHEVEGFLLARPVKHARISSYFTKRRFHPILKKYRAHLGVDYAARRGTPIVAAGSGRVIFKGRTRGYGNLIKIRHSDGYVTLYAHLKSFRRGIKKGKYVKKGHTIGYVGSTGLSTGPHLHFGLYKHGRAINPLRVVQVTTKKLKGKAKKEFVELKNNYNKSIDIHLENFTNYIKEPKPDSVCYFYGEKTVCE
ncbi:M23 family metallopeptidase [Sulfurimonas lithotrophica]|uniref:M23 family metallopeptidase n=1 Tax=Sulfurimonas lithotrophica TaxID=2590022 RepID=A0A5P8P2U2_9BACT|nr:peptidoglycan DD-metalloendopeptidase family protein [Sulfurimonas lithotrophica]QFR49941.1 M23 family metallopeptidase [Sulfurimonas lithotrophica]